MQSTHIMDAIKGKLLDLWMDVNNNDVKIFEYVKYIEEVFLKQFQMKYLEFYFMKENELHRLYKEKNPTEHIISIDSSTTFSGNDEVQDDLLQKAQAYCPELNSSLIIHNNRTMVGIMFFKTTDLWETFKKTPYLKEIQLTLYETTVLSKNRLKAIEESKLNEKLLRMTEVFHSTMNMDHIIEEIMKELKVSFSSCDYQLILSNDQEQNLPEKVHVFDYSNERQSTIKAFVSGELTSEELPNTGELLINAPIKGRQGTYGVIQLKVKKGSHFTEKNKMRLLFLGDSSGKALENAKLYHQSHRLVADLQLINESSHRLNMNLTQQEMLVYLSNLVTESFEPDEIAFIFMDDEIQLKTGTSPYFFTSASAVYLNFVTQHFKKSSEPLFIAEFSETNEGEGAAYHSLMAIPIIIRETVYGYALVLHEKPYYFSFDSYKLLQSIIRHSSLAISNVVLREQLQELVDRDHLTKLYARNYLDNYAEISVTRDNGGIFVLFDIDDFKKVNDNYGHQEGDRVLETVAQIISSEVRMKGICARWGGEEMAVYFPNETLEVVIPIVESISYKIAQLMEPTVTVSSGISLWKKEDDVTYRTVFKQADEALYYAKSQGKNQYQLYSKSSETELM
ncbi:MAG: diguanylate cyclase [Kurthia sp.]|nr:diguanylate cyclase [Candidatus Kurthia equi]